MIMLINTVEKLPVPPSLEQNDSVPPDGHQVAAERRQRSYFFCWTLKNFEGCFFLYLPWIWCWPLTSRETSWLLSKSSSCWSTGSPRLKTESSRITTGSPWQPAGSPRLPTGSPRLLTESPTLTTGSTWLPTGSPWLPTGSPTLPTGSPRLPAGSPKLPTWSPWLPTGSPRLPSGSPRYCSRWAVLQLRFRPLLASVSSSYFCFLIVCVCVWCG